MSLERRIFRVFPPRMSISSRVAPSPVRSFRKVPGRRTATVTTSFPRATVNATIFQAAAARTTSAQRTVQPTAVRAVTRKTMLALATANPIQIRISPAIRQIKTPTTSSCQVCAATAMLHRSVAAVTRLPVPAGAHRAARHRWVVVRCRARGVVRAVHRVVVGRGCLVVVLRGGRRRFSRAVGFLREAARVSVARERVRLAVLVV